MTFGGGPCEGEQHAGGRIGKVNHDLAAVVGGSFRHSRSICVQLSVGTGDVIINALLQSRKCGDGHT